jgi:NAD(P)-dependent dehydrogenase (short-subunit alcohol dehydrogenase family)
MPWAGSPTIVLGADGFIGAHLVRRCHAAGWPVYAIGRAVGDFTDAAVVEAALSGAPKAGRILHAITRQRTGPLQYGIQGELLSHCRIHGHMMERVKLDTPRLGKGSAYELDSRSFASGHARGIDRHDPRPA